MADLLQDLEATLADRYRIERELGRGGMGTVFLADDLRHHRKVALKVLPPHLAAAIGPERFAREVQLAARLTHPHILTVLDSGEELSPTGQPLFWYTMQFIDGESLAGRLEREGRLSLADAKRLLREVADALAYAHGQGVLHRDIKPENILLANGHALVVDFGIARPMTGPRSERLTETGLVVGTPGYMSPEQAAGEHNLDGRSDLFSLGCVYYEMLTGQSPFGGASPQAKMSRALSGQFTPVEELRPEAADTGAIFGRLLAPNPADRYPDAGTLVAELGRSSDHRPRSA
jgi:serine/threonine protein kinase